MALSSSFIFLINQTTTHSNIKPFLHIHPYFTLLKLAQAHCLNRCSILIAQELSSGTYISHKTWHHNGRDHHIIFGRPTVHCLELLPLPPDEDRRYIVLEIHQSKFDLSHSPSFLCVGVLPSAGLTNLPRSSHRGYLRRSHYFRSHYLGSHYLGSVVENEEAMRYAWIDVVLVEKAEEQDWEIPGDGNGYMYDYSMKGVGGGGTGDCERAAGITDSVYDQLLAKFADLDINEEQAVGKSL
ncbi:hypothetical protein K505DRAFT_336987 [Melanomma pulvis-pyrius CBS 109.77]|uniref:Uncharacterized protein n=1 Tax=Melanomma pulvis-pyrius CBS 109.77 TaxID=1314802 RepID=A0A6A6XFA0_9PLEO|nr:hypothetical protein K505DRAFT_336987 [Melanomma pulvis-pyrius CBS 109.77]